MRQSFCFGLEQKLCVSDFLCVLSMWFHKKRHVFQNHKAFTEVDIEGSPERTTSNNYLAVIGSLVRVFCKASLGP